MLQAQFSIRWKAVLFLSMVLIAISVSMVTLYTHTLLQEAGRTTQQSVLQQDQVLSSLLRELRDQQIQLTLLLPNLANVSESILGHNSEGLQSALHPHWLNLALNLNLNYLYMFDEQGSQLGGLHHQDQIGALELEQVRDIARMAAEDVAPRYFMSCTSQCTYYVVEPFITSRGVRGAIVIGRNISEIVVSFQHLLGVDLGVLIPVSDITSSTDARMMPNWGLHTWALSNFETQADVLKAIQADLPVADDSVFQSDENIHYRMHVLETGGVETINAQPRFISLQNITENRRLLENTIDKGITVGVLGWVLAELLLFMLILKPTRQLARITRALPLLAGSEFGQARKYLSPRNRRWFTDELDVLERTALKVCEELEALNQTVADNTRELHTQMTEQTRARQFVSRLLDTAPLIILTQSRDGQIELMNRWGREVTGNPGELDAPLSDFQSLHLPDTMPEAWLERLQDLDNIDPPRYQHEAQLKDRDGGLRYVTWLHSLVESEAGKPSILSVGMDLTKRVEAENKLSWLATHDTLTGLQNRHSFQKHLSRLLERGSRGALLFIDADRFKYINDTAGHNVGDSVLIYIAQMLEQHTRDSDVVARLGGDEFVILLPRASATTARAVMAKLSSLLDTHLRLANGSFQHFSCSLGGALYPDHGTRDEELLAAADMAMYTAKQQGQGKWHLYDASRAMIDRMQADLTWQEKIRLALSDDLFRLYFQPILDVTDNSISHYEVLLRMQNGPNEVIPPGDFIPVAERTGLIGQVDTWVLAESMKFLAAYNAEHADSPISLAVNISAPSIQSPTFDRTFFRLCDRHGISPDQIIIEITETAFLSEFQSALLTLEKLAVSGCRIALDDFGVGFSSFSYLKQMPLSYVKMDGSYVRELHRSPQEQIFVKCLTEMVSGFNMTTVAEFVETEEILVVLKRLGVKYAQGYLIGKPSPVIETAATLGVENLGMAAEKSIKI